MDRQELIERVYDASEFPHCARSVYGKIYYGLADAMNMGADEFRKFFPNLIDPMTQGYKLNEQKCAALNAEILGQCRLDILEDIAAHIENNATEYEDGYDSV